MQKLPIRLFLLFLCGAGAHAPLSAQLDTIHWFAPMYGSVVNGEQFIDLTTPETTPFLVKICNGAGLVIKTAMIRKGQAYRFNLDQAFTPLLLSDPATPEVLPFSGLVIHGSRPFNAAFRFFSDSKLYAAYLPAKGRAALGTVFRIGHTRQVTDKSGLRKNMIGILATEDATQVTLSGFNPMLAEFNGGGPITVTLQRGESIVYTHYVGGIGDDQPRNGFMGALVVASKPVTVTSGSWMGAPVIYDQANDICADQLLPLEQVGKDYILCRGNGPSEMEHPIVIAHSDQTKIWINGATEPDTVLQAGQYYLLPASYFLPPGNNLFIHSSAPVFVFQMIGGTPSGNAQLKTGSLMVVPPIQCGLAQDLDYVVMPNRLGNTRFNGSLMVVAQRGATITARVNNSIRALGDPYDVPGNPEFVTFKAKDFFSSGLTDSSLQVRSDGAILASMVLRNADVSYAAMFAGQVLRKPVVSLSLNGDGICPDTLMAQGVFDGIHWLYQDSLFQTGPSAMLWVSGPGMYKAIAYLEGCAQTAVFEDSIQVALAAPQFQYTAEDPSCFGLSDGNIVLQTPIGGAPPYRYSIDFGRHFSSAADFTNLPAGAYKLVVSDAAGCFNEPVSVKLNQPDSVFVNLYFKSLPKPLRPGDEVILAGSTGDNPVYATSWNPADSSLCGDCLEYTFRPEKSSWVTLTVYDGSGCAGIDSLHVLVTPAIYTPNIIHTGADSGNDLFMLQSEYPLPVQQLLIYSRWGALVFEKHDIFTNSTADAWDGTLDGKPLVPGVYIFTAWIAVEPGRLERISGDITLLR